jgi:predicted GNAT family N-acyltransferase
MMNKFPEKVFFGCIKHNSKEYREAVALRSEILRKPLGLAFSEAELQAESESFHLALFIENKVVACLILKPLNEKRVKMRQVAVAEHFQNAGLGSFLVRFAEFFALALGFEQVELHARETAMKFYLKMQGYNTVGEGFEEVGIPHYKMEKTLSEIL